MWAEKPAGWWYAFFKIKWPEGEGPALHTDLLLAHRVAAPVLEKYRDEIPLWRFHRRAARDEAGHRFSVIIHCTPATARKVFSAIGSSIVLEEMKAAGVVEEVVFDDTSKITRPEIGGVSDPSWSGPVRRAWPWFIMGVSQTWLDLIGQYARDGRPEPRTPGEMIEYYRGIDRSLSEAWTKEGGHALLHHLNAVFGYGPVIVRGKSLMSF